MSCTCIAGSACLAAIIVELCKCESTQRNVYSAYCTFSSVKRTLDVHDCSGGLQMPEVFLWTIIDKVPEYHG